MAAMWEAVDKNFPTFTGKESPGEQTEQIVNYLFLLREQLKYSLENLGKENWNEMELSQIQEASVRALSGSVARLSAAISDINSENGKLKETLAGITAENGELKEALASLIAAYNMLADKVAALEALHGEQTS